MNNKNNSYGKENENITSNQDKDNNTEEQELSSQMNQTLSPTRAILRIILGVLAFLIWIFIGVSPTIIFTSSLQGFVGVISFLIRNPIIFLLIAIINIILAHNQLFIISNFMVVCFSFALVNKMVLWVWKIS